MSTKVKALEALETWGELIETETASRNAAVGLDGRIYGV
jgi:hypothetical protein